MQWLEITLTTTEATADALAEAVRPYAHGQSVVFEQLGDPNDLDPHAMLPEVHVKIYVDEERDTADLRAQIRQIAADFACPPPQFNKLEEADWANAWREHYRPFRIGQRFWIQPSWLAAEGAEDDDIVLTLDPGMAFGTGLHATTQMCLEAAEKLVRPQMRVLDLGTGSGILAIGAAKLGARPILAVDTDPLAVEATRRNAAENGVENLIEVREGTLAVVAEKGWDVVYANILAVVIRPLLLEDGLLGYAAADGHLVLSGIVRQQLPEMEATIKQVGGEVIETLGRGDWVALVVRQLQH